MNKWPGSKELEKLRGPWPEIYFIRHGHGFHQVGYEMEEKGMAQSPREGLGCDVPNHLMPLSPLGRWQAKKTRKKLLVTPDCIYTSQITRAIETARIIVPNCDLRIDPRLNEKEFGPAHMLSKKELQEKFPYHMEWYERDGKYFASKAPGGENYIGLYLRAHSIIDTIRRRLANQVVFIVCHSAIMLVFRQLFEHFLPDDLLRIGEEEWIENCGILHYTKKNKNLGWERGKYRIKLAQPPYKLWDLKPVKEAKLWQQAMDELADLRQKYGSIKE